ncbi:MAG: ABC transporter ATP-binding protein [Candidatus Anammoxibacter sp.]
MININSVFKKFNSDWVLNDLNLNIKKGEFYCLLGPNGAGKTTTLKILTGLTKPTKGKIIIGGFDTEKDYVKVKNIMGYIPDTPFLYENLTPYEFLQFIGDIYGIKKDDVLERTDYYFDLFKLQEYGNSRIKELSHGTRQKIVYTANFVHSPEVYLIDEPLVGLDPYNIHLVKKLLKEETRKGKTILMCTHLLPIAEELADRIGILKEGKLFVEESPKQLKEKYGESLEEVFLKLTCS